MRYLKPRLNPIQLTIMLICLTASGGRAQSHIWSTGIDGYEGNRVAVDAAGNTVIAGRYDNSVLVAKFDAEGKQLWRKLFTRGNSWGPRITLDSGGDIVITGGFTMTISFGGGVLVSAGSEDMYLAKLSGLDGGHIWSRRFGSEDCERGVGIVVDDDSNVIVTGQFEGTANFGGGNLTSAGNFDVLVAKYNAAGFHIWSKSFGSPTRDQSLDVTVDELGNVIVTGKFIGSGIDFGGGPLNSAGIYDVFLAKLDANGAHLWSKSFGGPTNDSGAAVAVNESGDASITGAFSGSVSFGGDTLTAPGDMGERDIFVAKYRANGSHVWSQRFGSESDGDVSQEIAVDEAGNVIVTGGFYGTVDFGGGPIEAVGGDGFLAKYDSNGAHLWSRRLGGAGGDLAFGTATRGEGIVIVTGRFTPPADFGGGQLTEGGIFVGAYGDPKVPVALQGFDSYWAQDHVVVTWGLVAIDGELSFDIARSDAVRDRWVRMKDDEIRRYDDTYVFYDYSTKPGLEYRYRVVVLEDGTAVTSFETAVETPTTTFALLQNHPNPFNPATTIMFSVDKTGQVKLVVYDASGAFVVQLVDGFLKPRFYTFAWDGRNGSGNPVSSGVYFYRLTAGNRTLTKKMVLLR